METRAIVVYTSIWARHMTLRRKLLEIAEDDCQPFLRTTVDCHGTIYIRELLLPMAYGPGIGLCAVHDDLFDSIVTCDALDHDLYMMLTGIGMSMDTAIVASLQYD